MRGYRPRPLPAGVDPALAGWLNDELKGMVEAAARNNRVGYNEQNVTPTKPRTGDTAFADGTNWNPGLGKGLYTFDGSSWIPFGKKTSVLATTAAASGTQVNFSAISSIYD